MNHLAQRPSSPEGHFDGFEDQLGADMIGHRPADDPAALHVEHDGQREEAHPGRHIRNVRDPKAIRRGRSKLPPDKVRCGGGIRRATRRARPFAPVTASETSDSEQASNPFARARNPVVTQFGTDAGRTISAQRYGIGCQAAASAGSTIR